VKSDGAKFLFSQIGDAAKWPEIKIAKMVRGVLSGVIEDPGSHPELMVRLIYEMQKRLNDGVRQVNQATRVSKSPKIFGAKIAVPDVYPSGGVHSAVAKLTACGFSAAVGEVGKRPPLVLKPRRMVDEERMVEIRGAFQRYIEARKDIPFDWVSEFMTLLEGKVTAIAKTGYDMTGTLKEHELHSSELLMGSKSSRQGV
jgi:hypothetical protein